jgi:hypothetical protein
LTVVITELSNPSTFAFHVGKDLVVNGRDIYREINTAVKDWKAGDYDDFGVQVGHALYQLFVGAHQYKN